MKKIIIDKEVYLNYYELGLSDLKISKLMNINNSVLSKFRKALNLPVNRPKSVIRTYKEILVTKKFEQVLLGTLIGDGNLELDRTTKAKNARLRFGHSIKQFDYLVHKVNLLSKIWKMSIKTTEKTCSINSISILTKYYKLFYKNNEKVLPDVKLEPQGLAILYMDDGSFDKNTNSIYISLCNFTKKENLQFIKRLNRDFNLDCSLMLKGKKNNKYYHIYVKANSRAKFKNIVRPYLIDSMKYKIGE